MPSDRYVKGALTVIALALVAIAGNLWLTELRPRAAVAETPAKYEVGVPKAWGKLVGFSNNNLLLESSDGLLRIVDVEGKEPEYPKIKVQISRRELGRPPRARDRAGGARDPARRRPRAGRLRRRPSRLRARRLRSRL